MSAHGLKRLSEDIKREISVSVRNVISDKIVSVSRCELTGDLSCCKVFVSGYGGGDKTKEAVEDLKNSAGFFKRQINSRIRMRKIPELIFLPDDSLDYYDKINGIINELHDDTEDEHDDYRSG
ncbi:MAG: 30S ribosome-binding factor RbfA [Oscillospiraceae bacterium]|jgi:ribosome-binding factor A|nr:30S ribosome-binding factor RbfA [Oscillospiraceae bacterium]